MLQEFIGHAKEAKKTKVSVFVIGVGLASRAAGNHAFTFLV
jgi:hypothetical protein